MRPDDRDAYTAFVARLATALRDRGKPLALAESGAMLFYLASKTGRFLPASLADRWSATEWTLSELGLDFAANDFR